MSRWSGGFSAAALLFLSASPGKSHSDSWTLEEGGSRAVVTAKPHPRLAAFSAPGIPSLLLDDPAEPLSGLRFLALERESGRQIPHPFEEPATWGRKEGSDAVLRMVSGGGDLRLEARLEMAGGRLGVACSLTNAGKMPRELALWSIASLPVKGWLITPFSRGRENNHWVHGRLVAFYASSFAETCLQPGTEALGVRLEAWSGSPSWKFGTRSSAGWTALVRPERNALLLAQFPYSADDRFPDEDCNVTYWAGAPEGRPARAEMEWLSPWRMVTPGETLSWEFTLSLRELAMTGEVGADSLLHAIRRPVRVNESPPVPSGSWQLSAAGPQTRDAFGRVTEWFGAGEALVARAPLWLNAPRSAAGGSALEWTESTIVEAVNESLPEWAAAPRVWEVEFSPDPGDGESRLLLQDGGPAAGVALFLHQGKAVFVWWNARPSGELDTARVDVPIDGGRPVHLVARYEPGSGTVSLTDGDHLARKATASEGSFQPENRLAIGRNERFPQALDRPALKPFQGRLHRLVIRMGEDVRDGSPSSGP